MEFSAAAARAPEHNSFHTMEAGFTSTSEKKQNETTISEHEEASSTSGSADEKPHLHHTDTALTSFDAPAVLDTRIYRDGKLTLLPAPTRDPRDPLNMPMRLKACAAFCLCFFGALAAAAELILGSMLPVFALQYSGINPKNLLPWSKEVSFLPAGTNPLQLLGHLTPESPPIWKIYLLASLPILTIGVANLVLIPLAISIGRRPVVLICGAMAIGGCMWSGFSQSLDSHLAARCLQAFGAGTVESLIPFIIQDMCFFHERNTWISYIFAAQGVIIISLGFAAPYMIIYLNWRWVYYITGAGAAVFLAGVALLLPETRFYRGRSELNGIPRDDADVEYPPRTWAFTWKLFHGEKEWRKGWNAIIDTCRTFFYPQIFFITMLNSAMIATALAAGYTIAPALLVKPWSWPFLHLGFLLVPVLIAALFVGGITGTAADKIANYVAKKRGKRVPENQLLNLILPTLCGLIGSVLFGVTANDPVNYSWALFCFALGLMAFGFLGANTIGAVYVLECYPHLAGPSLVNIASFRCLIAFFMSFKVSVWVAELGYLHSMLIYTGIMAGFSLLLPVVYFYGPAWRKRWPALHFGEGREVVIAAPQC